MLIDSIRDAYYGKWTEALSKVDNIILSNIDYSKVLEDITNANDSEMDTEEMLYIFNHLMFIRLQNTLREDS